MSSEIGDSNSSIRRKPMNQDEVCQDSIAGADASSSSITLEPDPVEDFK